jgi:hypothetical protein
MLTFFFSFGCSFFYLKAYADMANSLHNMQKFEEAAELWTKAMERVTGGQCKFSP